MQCVIPLEADKEYFFDEGCFIIEQLQRPQDNDVSIARARVKPGVETKWHALHAITERYYIISGYGVVEIGDNGPESVQAGDVVVIAPGVRQRIRNCGEGDLVFLAICSPPFHVENYRDLTCA